MQDERLIGYRPHLEYTDEYTSDAADIFNSQQESSCWLLKISAASDVYSSVYSK